MKKVWILAVAATMAFASCKKDDSKKTQVYTLAGVAQKGPFVAGANVTIIELDQSLTPTGKTFSSTIDNNAGHFSFPNVEFASSYVQLKVEGQCYNEIAGGVDMSPITLSSIVDISSGSTINVNLLTQFEQARILSLVKSGKTVADAKTQAHTEILSIFCMTDKVSKQAEQLDITANTTEDGVLLFVSAVVCANGSGQTLQEFITNITTDFADNGSIDSETSQKALSDGAFAFSPETVKTNIAKRYSEMGKTVSTYQIATLKKQFLTKTKYSGNLTTAVPAVVDGAINLLVADDTVKIDKSQKYCMAANFDNKALSNLSIFITDGDDTKYSTTNANWYSSDNTKRLMITANTTIPIAFTDKGSLKITCNILPRNGGMSSSTKYIIWE